MRVTFESFVHPSGIVDVEGYLAAVAAERNRILAGVTLTWVRSEVCGSVCWTAHFGDLRIAVYEPHLATGSRFNVYVGRSHYSGHDSLEAALASGRDAAGYYAGLSPNMMGRYASATERATVRETSARLPA